jgi:hypothetical protein
MFTTSGRAMRAEDCVPGLIAYSAAKMAQVGLMVGLAAELHDTDIRVNAVSPVAATRVLRRNAPELRPELVAPGVAFLASSACGISGAVLEAAIGRFSAAWWDRSDWLDLGTDTRFSRGHRDPLATDRRIMTERRHSLRQSLHIDASGRRSYRRRGPRSPTGVQLFCKGEVR